MRDQAKNVIESFLNHKEKKVLLFTGDWGVGKSYFIRSFLINWTKQNKKQAAIASLFGIDDLQTIGSRLDFINADIDLAHKFKKPNFRDIGKFLFHLKDYCGDSISIPGIDIKLNHAFEQILKLMLNNGILVFDDVERKTSILSLESIFGSANQLSEKTLDKVIIVLSEKNLCDSDQKFLSDNREKVFDCEFNFKPSQQENSNIIIPNDEEKTSTLAPINVNNLRIIKQIKWAWGALIDPFDIPEKALKRHLLFKVALLTYIHFSKQAPLTLDEVRQPRKYLTAKEDNPDASKKKFLEQFRYYYIEDDQHIFDYLLCGYFDIRTWVDILKKYDGEEKNENVRKEWWNAWNSFNLKKA